MRTHLLSAPVFAVALLLTATPAVAAPVVESGHFHEEFVEHIDDLCGVEGQLDNDVQGNFTFNSRTGLFRESVRGTVVWTNLETGKTFTEFFHNNAREVEVTDNGDGTLDVVIQIAGGYYSLDSEGKLFLRDPGVVRFRVLIDAESGDFLEFIEDVKAPTGLNELEGHDFCEDFLTVTG